ncbi:PREDICTED: tRNA (cytosine(38)-C(5))-methyltransferase-like isoform X2 [Priapulus caudatus]|uniref:tRNA (cytosine(38)-C(5))-methyltransferase n=1 Tax=Priapulus caudatus TaxID=37621 RepID=A0ABM1ETU5_PRICU|nr:PREDICTED: tRNA (cytosine(38)-C(5))-methyltransferase-like isoform X2 [Priapulus caudatus]
MVETRVEHFTPGVATDHAMETVAGEHNQLRVLELYSGIGDSGLNYKIVAAVDINEKANIIYKHNFRETNLLQRNIESISVQQLDKMKIDLLTMSPPCQPFTRLGCQKDVSDPRAKSFLYLLNTLPKLENQPKYILLENVKGFETSNARAAFREMLDRCGYIYKEMLLSPVQLGIPNSRLRFYLIAKKSPLSFHPPKEAELVSCTLCHIMNSYSVCKQTGGSRFCADVWNFSESDQPCRTVKANNSKKRTSVNSNATEKCLPALGHKVTVNENACIVPPHKIGGSLQEASTITCHMDVSAEHTGEASASLERAAQCLEVKNVQSTSHTGGISSDASAVLQCWSSVCGGQLDDRKLLHNCQDSAMRTLGSYLSPHDMESRHQLPQQLVTRFLKVMDVVSPQSTRSCCFTKAYGRYIEGTGSVLLSDFTDSIHIVEGKAMHGTCAAPSTLRLSYFSPKDIANIMCFPTDYTFPKDCTSRDCYKVLGNSINIYVVSVLLRLLTLGDDL